MASIIVIWRFTGSRGFARLLAAATRPFDVVNYYGSCAGARFIGRQRMVAT
jgi:hypothetical protein